MRLPAHESSDRRRKALLPSIAIVAAFAWVIVPFEVSAAITVEPPTGNADPALLDELRAALEAVAAESIEVEGVFRLSAEPSGDDLAIVVELASSDGTEIVRESRVASRASASAQARAMAREAIRELTMPVTETAPPLAPRSVESAKTAAATTPPPRVFPDLDAPYDKGLALGLSMGVTFGGMVIGSAIMLCIFANTDTAVFTSGLAITQLAQALGPSLGYFYMRETNRALIGLILRTVLAAVATSLIGGLFYSVDHDDSGRGFCSYLGCVIGGSITAFALTLYTVIDLATMRRAAQRANEKALERKEAEEKISSLAFAPMIAPGPHGSTTAGLAFSMRF